MSTATETRPRDVDTATAADVLITAAPSIDLNADARQRRSASQKPIEPVAASAAECDPEAFLADAFTAYVEAATTLPRFIARHPRTTLRAIGALDALPVFDAELPETTEAGALLRLLLQHAGSRRMMRGISAVLTVPAESGTYTDGRDRATVRRKIRAAEKQGVTIRPVRDDERAQLLELANRHELENERAEYRIENPENDDLLDYALWLAAFDADGAPIMLSVTPVAGEWGVLRYFRTLAAGQASSDARYLMARELAETLCTRGVRYLVDSSRPHWLPNGLRHFQRMIGFRLVRVRRVRITGN